MQSFAVSRGTVYSWLEAGVIQRREWKSETQKSVSSHTAASEKLVHPLWGRYGLSPENAGRLRSGRAARSNTSRIPVLGIVLLNTGISDLYVALLLGDTERLLRGIVAGWPASRNNHEFPAAQVYLSSVSDASRNPNEICIAFDGDSVLFSDEAERIFIWVTWIGLRNTRRRRLKFHCHLALSNHS